MATPEVVRGRQQELTRLREVALDEGLPLVERGRAVVERMWLIDDILSEQLDVVEQGGEEG